MNRVVVAGIGPQDNSDDEPLEMLAAGLRNDGSEVIFAGWDQAPVRVVTTALQEDADAIGLDGATSAILAEVRARLVEEGAEDIEVFTSESVTSPTSSDRGQ